MLITLRFRLPEEQDLYDTHRNGSRYLRALTDLRDKLRYHVKYEENASAVRAAFDKVYEEFYDVLNDNGVEL